MKKVFLLFMLLLFYTASIIGQVDAYKVSDAYRQVFNEKMKSLNDQLKENAEPSPNETRAYDLEATLYADGALVINGTISIPDYNYDEKVYPLWYAYRAEIKRIVIGNGVKGIGQEAFHDCPNLQSVSIGSSVTSIGFWAFKDCVKLQFVDIPPSVASISLSPFFGCFGLKAINVDARNKNYSSLEGVLYSKNKIVLVSYPGGKVGHFSIPNSVVGINHFAFGLCIGLTSVTIPTSVTEIGAGAFGLCLLLPSLSIPKSVMSIEDFAFMGCEGLSSIKVYWNDPRVVTYGKDIFSYIDYKSRIQLLIPEKGITSVYRSIYPWKDFYVMPTGISDIENLSIKLYPNPATDFIIINGAELNETVQLYDMKGRLLLTHKIINENEQISIEQLVEGIYIVKIGNRHVVKLLKR